MSYQPLRAEFESSAVFGYGVARHTWLMLGALVGGVILVLGPALLLGGGSRVFTDDTMLSVGIVMIILSVVMLPVPIMDILWSVRGKLILNIDGIAWRGWGARKSHRWDEVIAIGAPPEDPRRVDDQRIHVVMEDQYDFIHGYNLRRREEAIDLMRAWGGFTDRIEVGPYTFMCRRGKADEVRDRASTHIHPGPDEDPWSFWAGRFRRF